jgi:putative membrane protein
LRAAASVVVDLTAESESQLFFTLFGLAVLSIALSPAGAAPWLLAGFATMLPVAAVPVVARSRRVLRLLEGLAARVASSLKLPRRDDGETLVETVHGIFRRRAAVAGSVVLHLVAWLAAAVETWALLAVSGHPLPFSAAVAIEALVFAVRGAIFMVPSSIGVQEGGYVVVAALFGLGPETALALSLIKRARDLVLGIPGLILWQATEGTRLRRRLAAATPRG